MKSGLEALTRHGVPAASRDNDQGRWRAKPNRDPWAGSSSYARAPPDAENSPIAVAQLHSAAFIIAPAGRADQRERRPPSPCCRWWAALCLSTPHAKTDGSDLIIIGRTRLLSITQRQTLHDNGSRLAHHRLRGPVRHPPKQPLGAWVGLVCQIDPPADTGLR